MSSWTSLVVSATLILCYTPQAFSMACDASVKKGSALTSYSPRLVIISGTHREDANALKVAKQVQLIANQLEIPSDILDIGQIPITTFSGKKYWKTPKSFQQKYDQKIADADALVFVFPEYYGTYSGSLHLFMEFMQASLVGKPVALMGESDGMWGSIRGADQLDVTLRHRKAIILGQAQVNITGINQKLGPEGQIQDAAIQKRITEALKTLIREPRRRAQDQALLLHLAKQSEQKFVFDFNSGVTVHGQLDSVLKDSEGRVIFAKWKGPVELLEDGVEIPEQGTIKHGGGFSTPIGPILVDGLKKPLSAAKSFEDLAKLGLVKDVNVESKIQFASGFRLTGRLTGATFSSSGQLQVLTFEKANVKLRSQFYYREEWGSLDLLVGETLESIQLK